jgi:hypothetical protein
MRSREFADQWRWAWKIVGPRGRLRQLRRGECQVAKRVAPGSQLAREASIVIDQ